MNSDDNIVVRGWKFVRSLLAATGTVDDCITDHFSSRNRKEVGVSKLIMESEEDHDDNATVNELTSSRSIKELCVINLELYPVKVTVSFTSSRTSSAVGVFSNFILL